MASELNLNTLTPCFVCVPLCEICSKCHHKNNSCSNLKWQKLRPRSDMITSEKAFLSFIPSHSPSESCSSATLPLDTFIDKRFLKSHRTINWYVSWIRFKPNAYELYVIIVHLKIMAINILIISNSLNFYYKISRVKQQVQYWSRLSRRLGINRGLINGIILQLQGGW